MVEYKAQTPVAIPEYGRNLHQMVEHCKTIKDREERNRCACAIVKVMGGMFPERVNKEDNNKVIWDHLAIMANFDLDVDYPVEVIQEDKLSTQPDPIAYPASGRFYRHYGTYIQKMVNLVVDMPQDDKRKQMELMVANQMKRLYQIWNSKTVDDYIIFKELYEISDGRIVLKQGEDVLIYMAYDNNKNNKRSTNAKNNRNNRRRNK